MFDKLWQWLMGIIAWVMSFFSRKSGGASESDPAEVEQAAADDAGQEQESAPTPSE
jgi:hypothetical protein